jgi:hypothetical protein
MRGGFIFHNWGPSQPGSHETILITVTVANDFIDFNYANAARVAVLNYGK